MYARYLGRLLLIIIALAVLPVPAQAVPDAAVPDGMDPAGPNQGVLLGECGRGFLEEIRGQLVLHLSGTPYEMGFQHGRLLGERAHVNAESYFSLAARRGVTREVLLDTWARCEPFIPAKFQEELRGLAEGAALPQDDVRAFHMIPIFFHCSGAAVFGAATTDGNLYHYRSLDYSLGIGGETKVQENACLIVYRPDGEIPHVVVSWAGAIGCVTGMNAEGISVGEMGSGSSDEDRAGLPMWLHLRNVLGTARTLDQAVEMFRAWPRECGYNFIVTDGKIPDARAIEVTHSRIAIFVPGDPAEDVAPHFPIECCVRRVNHFVSPDLAATQRDEYDPRVSEQASWLGYHLISLYIQQHFGRLDAASMIGLCRSYPPQHSCLHQAVFSPRDGRLWVSNARDPDEVTYAGAQNQTFFPYSLPALLATDPARLARPAPASPVAQVPPEAPPAPAPGATAGVAPATHLDLAAVADAALRADLARFDDGATSFPWTLERDGSASAFAVYQVTFPSPFETPQAANNTVHGLYFPPEGGGRHPGVVVLHHLGGSFEIEEMLCRRLAIDGVAALFIWLPYYGARGADGRVRISSPNDIDQALAIVRQSVMDIRRAADWLAARPEIDPGALGVVGVSLGAVIGSLAAGVDPRLHRNVFILGGGDLAAILTRSAELSEVQQRLAEHQVDVETLRAALATIEPLRYASRIDPQGTLMINARGDTVVPHDGTLALWERIGHPRIVWYDGDHVDIAIHVLEIFDLVSDAVRYAWF